MRTIATVLVVLAALESPGALADEPRPEAQPSANGDAPEARGETPESAASRAVRPEARRGRARRSPERAAPGGAALPMEPGARIVTEGLAGVLASGAGAIAGGALAYSASANSSDVGSVLTGVTLAAGAGAAVSSWLSTWLVGSLGGAKGDPGAAFLGALVGGGLSLLILIPVMSAASPNDQGPIQLAAGAVLLIPPSGAVLGYELSQPSRPDSTTAPPVQLMPAVSLTRDGRGGLIGIAGVF